MDRIYINNLSNNDNKLDILKNLFNWEKISFEIVYKSDFTVTKDLRDFIELTWELFCLSKDVIARIILLSDELNNNAIEYWSDNGWDNFLRLNIEKNNDTIDLNIEVEDNWKWKCPKTALEMETMRAHKLKIWYGSHNSIRWRWLFLIAVKVADRLYFKNSKKWWLIVWVKKKIKL